MKKNPALKQITMPRREVPPTAGLPVKWRDFAPRKIDFARALSDCLEIPEPILCCSGTAALVVALKVLAEDSSRDKVIVPAFSCPLVVLAIVNCGLKVELCDTASSHFDFNFSRLQTLADERTLAIIPTHMGGCLADMVATKNIAQTVGAYVIEDAAWATGAKKNGQSIGLMGDIGFFSLAVGKGLTSFEGGVLFTSSDALRQRLNIAAKKLLPVNGWWELRRIFEFISYALFYRPSMLPYVYGAAYRQAVKNNDWLTALGDRFSAKIPMHRLGGWRQGRATHALMRLNDFHETARARAKARIKILKQIPQIQIIDNAPGDDGVYPFIMVVFPSENCRDAVLHDLTPLGLGVSRLFTCALNEYDYLKLYIRSVDMPVASDFARRLLTISNSPWLSDPQFEIIVASIKNALS